STFVSLTGCEPKNKHHRMVRSDLAGSTQPRSSGKMTTTMEQVKTKSVEPHTRFALPEVNWDELNEPGAYVERGSGDLYRVPKEAIIPGGSPIIHKESIGSSRLVQVSKNPFVTTLAQKIHKNEDAEALFCYKHVVQSVFAERRKASACPTITQH